DVELAYAGAAGRPRSTILSRDTEGQWRGWAGGRQTVRIQRWHRRFGVHNLAILKDLHVRDGCVIGVGDKGPTCRNDIGDPVPPDVGPGSPVTNGPKARVRSVVE